jgi:translation initiation factor 2B subunit (eIF-2B alpha/beta/delta family)
MPDSDNLVTGIIFSTNANSVADEVHNLDNAINAVEKTQDRIDQKENKKKKEKIRTPQEVFRIYSKMLQRYTKQQQKADKEKIKDTKSLVNLEKQRFNLAKGLVRYAASAVSVGAVINYVAETMRKGRQYTIASNATGQNAQTIESIGFMGKKYGGSMSTAANDILGLNQGIKAIEMGLNPYEELARLFPNAYNDIFFDKNRRLRTDPVAILQKISELMQGMDARTVQAFGNALGLSESMILLLKSSDGKFSEILAENMKIASINQEQSKKLDDALGKFDELGRGASKALNSIITAIGDLLPEDKKKLQKVGEAGAKLGVGAGVSAVTAMVAGGKGLSMWGKVGLGAKGGLQGLAMMLAWMTGDWIGGYIGNNYLAPFIKEEWQDYANEKYGKPIKKYDRKWILNKVLLEGDIFNANIPNVRNITDTPFNQRGFVESAINNNANSSNVVNNNGDIVINTTSDNPQNIAKELQRVMQTYDYFNNLNGSNPFKNLLIQSSGNVKN